MSNTAETIVAQMGGKGKLVAMLGAHSFMGEEVSVTFKWKAKSKDGSRALCVSLTPEDTYTMDFFKINGIEVKKTAHFEGVYFDQLKEIFESQTGLYLSLL